MAGSEQTRTLGVLGTLVWDTLWAPGADEPRTGWGGLAYALAGVEGSLPDGWEVVPVVKVGGDLIDDARTLLESLSVPVGLSGLVETDADTNRVELRYQTPHERTERLTGGVPPWQASELLPLVESFDALYVNFISGFELDLRVAREVLKGFSGPVYADLHSLFLGRGDDGLRRPKPLSDWEQWFACFDVVQMNEPEFALLGVEDPWDTIPLELELAGFGGPEAMVVTRGPQGATFSCSEDLPGSWRDWSGRRREGRRRLANAPHQVRPRAVDGDPTGCGDVFGATAFCQILRGDSMPLVFDRANQAASEAVSFPGAEGLGRRLRTMLIEETEV